MPAIRKSSRRETSGTHGLTREQRHKARLRQRVVLGGLVLLIGAALGTMVAWWVRRDIPAAEAVAAASPASPPTGTVPTRSASSVTVPATSPPKNAPAAPIAPVSPVSPVSPKGAAVAPQTQGNPQPLPAVSPPSPSNAALQQMDVAELLRDPTTASTGWKLARLRGNPAVMVLEFPDLVEQGAAMNRIAALVEKAGAPRDRVLSDVELHQLITAAGDNAQTFYQGHDYVAEQIARFFTLAHAQGQAMNVHEMKLRQLLLDKKVLSRDGDKYVSQGLQAIVTFTAPQADDPSTPQDEGVDDRRRESVLMHELSHGLYFTSREYRDHCWRFWREQLSNDERQLIRRLLMRMNYDAANEDLLVNEMQALLMHTPDSRAFNGKVLGVSDAKLDEMRRRFRKGWPAR